MTHNNDWSTLHYSVTYSDPMMIRHYFILFRLNLTRLFPISSRHADKDFTWHKLFFIWSRVNMMQTAIMFCQAAFSVLFFFITLLWSFHKGKTIHQINSIWSYTICLLQSNLYKHLGVNYDLSWKTGILMESRWVKHNISC